MELTQPAASALTYDVSPPVEPAAPVTARMARLPADPLAAARVREHLVAMALTPVERSCWDRLPTPRRRSQWLLGRLAAKQVVRSVVLGTTGSPLLLSDIEVVAGRYGQPQAAVLRPGTPGGRVLVSISHSGNAAVAVGCAEVHAAGIGVDIEVCRGRPGVERKGLTAAELSRLEHVPESMRTETVLRWWCAKEAAAKALGLGLHRSGGAHRIEVTELRPHSSRLAVAVPSVAGGPARVLHAVTRRDGDVVLAAVVNARSGVHQRGSGPALRLG